MPENLLGFIISGVVVVSGIVLVFVAFKRGEAKRKVEALVEQERAMWQRAAEGVRVRGMMAGKTVGMARVRLRAFVRQHKSGGCKILSKGDDCVCELCLIDFLVEQVTEL